MYVLDSSPLLDVLSANIFSQACLLILLTFSFEELKFLGLLMSSLAISFVDGAFDGLSKKISPYAMSSRLPPMLSSWSFSFTFRSVTYFQLIFTKGIRSVSRYYFFFLPLLNQL